MRLRPTFTARRASTLRRNAVLMPLYSLTLVLILCAGFSAVLIVPGLPGRRSRPSDCGAPDLPGLVPGPGGWRRCTHRDGSGIRLHPDCSATLFAKNLVRPLIAPHMSDGQVACWHASWSCCWGPAVCARHLQLKQPGVDASDGLRGSYAILPRRRAGPLLAPRNHAGGGRRHARGSRCARCSS